MNPTRVAGVVVAVLLFISLVVGAFSCRSVTPDAGTEAVLVRKPLIFGSGGVDPVTVKTGRRYVMFTTEPTYVNMRPMQWVVHFDDLMTHDGVPLDFDIAMQYRITDAVACVQKFGCDDKFFDRNVERPFRDIVRDAVRKRGMNETAIDASASDAIDAEITKGAEALIKSAGLPLALIDIALGKANPPDAIKTQRIETAAQEQRINTEKQRKLAEDQRLMAEQSRAAADNAYREAMKLSPDQFLQLKSIDALSWACAERPGTCTFITNGVLPTLGIK